MSNSKPKFMRSPEINHPDGWIDNGDMNREKIYLGIKYILATNSGDEQLANELWEDAYSKGYEPLFIPSLDYSLLATIDPDEDGGEQLILDHLTGQIMKQMSSNKGEAPLALSIIEMMLSLIEHNVFSSVCAAEIALINFVDFNKYVVPSDAEEYAILDDIRLRLSGNRKTLAEQIFVIRDALGNPLSSDGKHQEPDASYISRCEEIAKTILGEKEFNEKVIPSIEAAAWSLDATKYFTYKQYGFTQNLKNSTYQQFLNTFVTFNRLLKDNERERLKNGQPPVSSEVPAVIFDWGLIRRIFSMFSEPNTDGNKPMEKAKVKHRFGTKPLSASVLAELTCGKFLKKIDAPKPANHNCTCTSESDEEDMFLHHAPSGKPDAFAQYGNVLFVTMEVSTARDKNKPEPSNEDSAVTEDVKGTVYFGDIQRAINHIEIDASNKGHNMERPKFVFLVSKNIPKEYAKESLNEILIAAKEHSTIVIPMTFKNQVKFMDEIREVAGIEPSNMTMDEWFRILHGVMKRMDKIDMKSPSVDLENLSEYLLNPKEMKRDINDNENNPPSGVELEEEEEERDEPGRDDDDGSRG